MLGSWVLGLVLAAGAARPEQLAVFEFKGDGAAEIRAEMTRVARRASLAGATGRADVVDPEMIAVLANGSTPLSCAAGTECELELVGALGATLAMTGAVHASPAGLVLEVKLFENRGARVRQLAAESASASAELSLLTATDDLVRRVLRAGFARLDAEAAARANVARGVDWEARRASLRTRRSIGWWTAAAGAATGLVAGWFALRFRDEDRKLQTSLPTAADITRAQDRRDLDQKLAIGSGAVGGALVLGGLGVVLFSRDPGAFHAEAVPVPGGGVVAAGGRF